MAFAKASYLISDVPEMLKKEGGPMSNMLGNKADDAEHKPGKFYVFVPGGSVEVIDNAIKVIKKFENPESIISTTDLKIDDPLGVFEAMEFWEVYEGLDTASITIIIDIVCKHVCYDNSTTTPHARQEEAALHVYKHATDERNPRRIASLITAVLGKVRKLESSHLLDMLVGVVNKCCQLQSAAGIVSSKGCHAALRFLCMSERAAALRPESTLNKEFVLVTSIDCVEDDDGPMLDQACKSYEHYFRHHKYPILKFAKMMDDIIVMALSRLANRNYPAFQKLAAQGDDERGAALLNTGSFDLISEHMPNKCKKMLLNPPFAANIFAVLPDCAARYVYRECFHTINNVYIAEMLLCLASAIKNEHAWVPEAVGALGAKLGDAGLNATDWHALLQSVIKSYYDIYKTEKTTDAKAQKQTHIEMMTTVVDACKNAGTEPTLSSSEWFKLLGHGAGMKDNAFVMWLVSSTVVAADFDDGAPHKRAKK